MGMRAAVVGVVFTGVIVWGLASLPLEGWARQALRPEHAGPRQPVLVELFTSEGCSSCPAADAYLEDLLTEQPVPGVEIIGLSEHVDYWNRLGWTDPFSSSAFSQRQATYARVLGGDRIYTPQLVVDGAAEAIGSDRRAVPHAIGDASATAKVPMALVLRSRAPTRLVLDIRLEAPGAPRTEGNLQLMVAVAEDGLVSKVARGENAHRTLRHVGVVRTMTQVATVDVAELPRSIEAALDIDPSWPVAHLRCVAFLHDDRLRVRGVGQVRAKD